MVRIAGIDRDISEVELMLHSMSVEDSIQETMTWLANMHTRLKGDFEGVLELDGGKKIQISVSEVNNASE